MGGLDWGARAGARVVATVREGGGNRSSEPWRETCSCPGFYRFGPRSLRLQVDRLARVQHLALRCIAVQLGRSKSSRACIQGRGLICRRCRGRGGGGRRRLGRHRLAAACPQSNHLKVEGASSSPMPTTLPGMTHSGATKSGTMSTGSFCGTRCGTRSGTRGSCWKVKGAIMLSWTRGWGDHGSRMRKRSRWVPHAVCAKRGCAMSTCTSVSGMRGTTKPRASPLKRECPTPRGARAKYVQRLPVSFTTRAACPLATASGCSIASRHRVRTSKRPAFFPPFPPFPFPNLSDRLQKFNFLDETSGKEYEERDLEIKRLSYTCTRRTLRSACAKPAKPPMAAWKYSALRVGARPTRRSRLASLHSSRSQL